MDVVTKTATLGRAEFGAKEVDLFLNPPLQGYGLLDWNRIHRLVDVGYRYTRDRILNSPVAAELAQTEQLFDSRGITPDGPQADALTIRTGQLRVEWYPAAMSRCRLPIDAILGEVVKTLDKAPAVVLQAPPGAGKTTRVPVALATASYSRGRVVVLQPRRVAARAAARRIAAENGWRVGVEVGYQIRFDRCFCETTRILVVTEGILVTMLQRDPFLEGVDAVVFDEFHERSLATDLSLAMARRVQQDVRPDLRIIVMSATLDCTPVARYLGDIPVITCSDRTHAVEVRHLERPLQGDPAAAAADGVRRLLPATAGDLLVFLPGMAWIKRCARHLEPLAAAADLAVMVLHGDIAGDVQDQVLRPADRRKVVLATNIAETSLTVEGVSAVVDTGLARVLRFDQGCGLNRLEMVRISRASANQRSGRAGRQGPGVCLRLWTEAEERGLRDAETPEIARLELSGPILQLLAWGESDVTVFPWFEAPPPAAVTRALDLLHSLAAVDAGGVTGLGQVMAALPVEPRLARLLVTGHHLGNLDSAALAAALLSERPRPEETVDLSREVATIQLADPAAGNQSRWQYLIRVRDQLQRIARSHLGPTAPASAPAAEVLAKAVLAAFPDRLARRRPGDRGRALMVGGRGIYLDDRGEQIAQDLLVAVEVTAGARGQLAEALVRRAVPVERSWLPETHQSRSIDSLFDNASQRVRTYARQRWLDLVVADNECSPPDPDEVSNVLAEAAAADIKHALALDSQQVESFLSRLHCLGEWRPELELPSFSTEELVAMLPTLCQGRRSFAELRQLPLVEILGGMLSQVQRQALADEAPERLQAPSGSSIRLRYEPGRPPVMAVRLQEMFGLAETPTVAGGRVRVLLHLLAPNMRPQQVTNDLASFWANTYPQVRAELRGRYPKHFWPEDPLAASPTRSTRRRRT
jgi:ATP-dependent helicase HrpB